jgi:hypothetical protein
MCQMIRGWIRVALCAIAAAAGTSGAVHAQGATEVYFGTFYKPVCDKLVAGFEAATVATYPAWEQRHHAEVAALESNPEFQAKRKEALTPPPAEIAAAKSQELSVTCERLTNLYEAASPADVRFNAPERTWDTFRKALREGNRDALRMCLTGDARKTLIAPLQAMTDEQLKRMGDSVAELKLMPGSGNFQEAVVIQRDGAAGRVAFVKTGENWKIAQM